MCESKNEKYSCSFCGKDKYQVKKLIVGKSVDHIICEECVLICMIICFNENFGSIQQYAQTLFAELKGTSG